MIQLTVKAINTTSPIEILKPLPGIAAEPQPLPGMVADETFRF